MITSLTHFDPTDLHHLRRYLAATGETLKPLTARRIHVAEDALDGLGELVAVEAAGARPIVLVMDRTPILRDGGPAKPQAVAALRAVGGAAVQTIELGEPDKPPHASLTLAETVSKQLPSGALVVSMGSGTITDVTKHAVHLAESDADAGMTLICCPTACTVTAYTSTMTVLTVDGVKRTSPSRGPDVVWADLRLIAEAPRPLTAAGFGDMMARCVAAGDWYLAHRVGLDPDFSTVPLDLLAHSEAMLFEHAAAIGRGDPAAVRHLVDALLLAGVAMSVANQTAPISGWEHTISHYLDLRHLTTDRPLGLHGAQVGAASLIAARAYAGLLDDASVGEGPAPSADETAARQQIENHFAGFGAGDRIVAELWRDYQAKWEQWVHDPEAMRRFRDGWSGGTLREDLRRFVREPERIARALDEVGAPLGLAESAGCDPEAARDAVRFAHLVRRRFTLGDLLASLGWCDGPRVDRWMTGSPT